MEVIKEREMNKKIYEAPATEMIVFERADIITSSDDQMSGYDLEYEEEA